MSQSELMIYGIAALAFVAVVGVGLAFFGDSAQDKARKRARSVSSGGGGTTSVNKEREEVSQRRRENQRMLAKLREDGATRKKSLIPQNIGTKIGQAGFSFSPTAFWIGSLVLGIVFAVLAFVSGAEGIVAWGMELKSRPVMIAASGVAGGVGLPRWILGFLAKRRSAKLTRQFGDGIDIIVRGVKSGLPLNECLRIIARESPAPLGPEFVTLTDALAMGTDLERALQNFYKRVPLPEINFFVIVLTIQSKSGGNLSEALGNLSSVIRQRRMMREKVKAMSSEAKASGMIIGALPFVVGGMVFMSSPDYIMELFITETGHFLIVLGASMMSAGIFVMRKMINFDM